MKPFFLIIVTSCLLPFYTLAQSINHPTIEKLRVIYKPVPVCSNTLAANGAPDIKVQAKMVITLKPDTTASTIYVKVISKQTNTIVYQVNYPLNSAAINGDGGTLLYKKENNTIEIYNPSVVSLKPYVYELYTEDAQGKKSDTYSITQ